MPRKLRVYICTGLSCIIILQISLFMLLLISLDLVADLELKPVIKSHATLTSFLHLRNIFLDVLQRRQSAYSNISIINCATTQ